MAQQGRRVLVTGGSSGIGLAIARAFRDAGEQVCVAGRDPAKLEASGFERLQVDVCDEAALDAAIASAPPFDIVIANAGGAATAPLMKMARADWDRMLALNLTSVWLTARATVPAMIREGQGRFIAIGSTASVKGYAYAGAYAAAKHGVLGMIRSLALELAKTGATANAICPGYTDTPMLRAAMDGVAAKTGRGDVEASFAAINPMGRLIAPHEVAAAALWLASDAAASVNGQAILIDGGETA
ncbi:SDR family oxidoreductase [Sphingomonas sp. MAH-20]|uniref:SDR family oxidoreductase n=1 Tax=Sphingomonas horti TaxID=2682842 RepID=A0A6I4J347_9SPHN|nr:MULTISPECIES: SDR family NAD(P)-dependent oxidoreductase [Sphingomonas]MBA2919628.1 SDR family oxidoreductase [Sphingomonas sp. CGMCC 1.13658]MVO78508.1 SDR family oxidoreductase [Sphingomonas horti]